jgi:uncharacterized membrane protein (DUF485 family)
MAEDVASRIENQTLSSAEYHDLLVNGSKIVAGFAESGKAEKALNIALDSRKFEIELYWKRATYFWTLLAAAFVGFYATRSDNGLLPVAFAGIGLLLSWAWFLVSKGSKYWQENWEKHVDLLEDRIIGPLHKILLRNDPEFNETIGSVFRSPNRFGSLVTQSDAFSVSKINQWVSLYITIVWVVVFASAILRTLNISLLKDTPTGVAPCILGATTCAFCLAMLFDAKISTHARKSQAVLRKTEVYQPLAQKATVPHKVWKRVLREETPKIFFQVFLWGAQAGIVVGLFKLEILRGATQVPQSIVDFVHEKINITSYLIEVAPLIVIVLIAYLSKARFLYKIIGEEIPRICYLIGSVSGSLLWMVVVVMGKSREYTLHYLLIFALYIGLGLVCKLIFANLMGEDFEK